jgi:hypothetical protein
MGCLLFWKNRQAASRTIETIQSGVRVASQKLPKIRNHVLGANSGYILARQTAEEPKTLSF